ncbi:MAG: DUF4249 domain-containing protein [Phycisphaerales bacterium]|nr:DUF4249 domain-containing protein [Phycisphaerales bacterium]
MKHSFNLIALSCILLFAASCQKVINVDLKNTAPRVVVEGIITDQPGLTKHLVLLSKSNNFSADNTPIPIVGALVWVEDATANIKDTLSEDKPGAYYTHKILGVAGHTYKLNALADGIIYTSESTMPYAATIDSLRLQIFGFFGQKEKQVIPVFKDSIGIKNYYRFSIQINDSVLKSTEAWDDKLTDGKTNSRPLNINEQDLFDENDTVIVTMNCTDKANFDFFSTLQNALGDGQTPANPTSNISGNALGYFGAHTLRKSKIIIP